MTHTYMRETISNKRTTCPCCLRPIKTKTNGQMVRHGWKETGRQVGQWGCGYQWGSCNGWGSLPLETTDRDALKVVAGLTREIKAISAEIKRHATGKVDHYVARIRVADLGNQRFKDEETARQARSAVKLTEAGFEYDLEEVKPTKHWQRHSEWFAKVTVAKGQEAHKEYQVYVPSYEEMRTKAKAQLEKIRKGLEDARTAIQEAIRHHKANPSTGKVEKTGPVVHLACNWKNRSGRIVGKCSQYSMRPAMSARTTEDHSKVTCKRCLKSLANA